ncbi:MAG: M67 family metallopeptidase [Candidatus Omnitrophica bacterium]|nr:M67 family metallopeptidase [Candidatus Omnitrophota bacterium]
MAAQLRIRQEALETMFEHCRREYPNEACGYLGGREGRVTRAYPIRNDAASPTYYEMNPGGQLQAQRRMREEGLEHLAVYHSHVATEAFPSRRDVDRATAVQDFFDGYYVLVTLKDAGPPRARAFTIRDGHVAEEGLVEE